VPIRVSQFTARLFFYIRAGFHASAGTMSRPAQVMG
jgi:hypothetical protein